MIEIKDVRIVVTHEIAFARAISQDNPQAMAQSVQA